MYLETFLKTLDKKADVCIHIDNVLTYGDGCTMQDTCGNHHTENWMDAITLHNMEKIFVIKNITVEVQEWRDKPQYIVDLVNGKDIFTDMLEQSSNDIACARFF